MTARTPAPVFDAPTPGAVKCASPGCPHWFVRNSGRHAYCGGPRCTYRRGAPPERALEMPTRGSAAEELLRRLQDEEGEVGPAALPARFRALQDASRAGDREAVYGALMDLATTATWFAERVRRNEMPVTAAPVVPGAPQRRSPTAVPQVGLAAAAIASHRRTYVLAERRSELTWALIARRETAAGLPLLEPEQVTAIRVLIRAVRARQLLVEHDAEALSRVEEAFAQATLAPEAAAEALEAARAAERALTSLEAAWRERGEMLRELEGAAVPRPVTVG